MGLLGEAQVGPGLGHAPPHPSAPLHTWEPHWALQKMAKQEKGFFISFERREDIKTRQPPAHEKCLAPPTPNSPKGQSWAPKAWFLEVQNGKENTPKPSTLNT